MRREMMRIQQKEAVRIADTASRKVISIPKNLKPVVEETWTSFIVTYPTTLPPGVRGSDYYTKATVNKRTGKIKKLLSAEVRVKQFVQLILAQAQKQDAIELAISAIDGSITPMREKVKGQWYDCAPPPAYLRNPIVTELGLLADLPEGPFPKQGTIETVTDDVSSKWELSAPSADGEWMLRRSTE
jgi:hypothetical protein